MTDEQRFDLPRRVTTEVERGAELPGLYPPNEDAKARYAAWRKQRD